MKIKQISRILKNYSRFVALLGLLNLLHVPPLAATEAFEEYEIKAVYLLNFASFVFWPRPTGDSFAICILGADPFGNNLDITVEGENIAGQAVAVKRIKQGLPTTDCNMLFISQAFAAPLDDLLQPSKPLLTISDRENFIQQGGMIQFTNSTEQQVRFSIAPRILEQAGLQVSTDLLEIAEVVE